jgi:pyruvyltransferase
MQINLKFFQKYPNAGDQFSQKLAEHYFGPDIAACDQSALTRPNLILLGSILEWSDAMSHICGAGFLSSESKLSAAPRSIHCVRGPLTAGSLKKQGINCPNVFGDPGALAPVIFPPNQSPDIEIAIMPHYVDKTSPWIEAWREMQWPIIDVFSPLDEFFQALQRCEVILSSSLHGIIFAHAYGKRALWIELSDRVIGDGFKFFDYYSSIGVPPEKVTRWRITDETDPGEIAGLATAGNQTQLLGPLQMAIAKTKRELQAACQ